MRLRVPSLIAVSRDTLPKAGLVQSPSAISLSPFKPLMRPGSYAAVVVDALILQDAADLPAKDHQVQKAQHGHPIGLVDADVGDVCQLALDRRDDGSAQDHHDQKGGSLGLVFSGACQGQGKDAGPHHGAKQTAAQECVNGDLSGAEYADAHGHQAQSAKKGERKRRPVPGQNEGEDQHQDADAVVIQPAHILAGYDVEQQDKTKGHERHHPHQQVLLRGLEFKHWQGAGPAPDHQAAPVHRDIGRYIGCLQRPELRFV